MYYTVRFVLLTLFLTFSHAAFAGDISKEFTQFLNKQEDFFSSLQELVDDGVEDWEYDDHMSDSMRERLDGSRSSIEESLNEEKALFTKLKKELYENFRTLDTCLSDDYECVSNARKSITKYGQMIIDITEVRDNLFYYDGKLPPPLVNH